MKELKPKRKKATYQYVASGLTAIHLQDSDQDSQGSGNKSENEGEQLEIIDDRDTSTGVNLEESGEADGSGGQGDPIAEMIEAQMEEVKNFMDFLDSVQNNGLGEPEKNEETENSEQSENDNSSKTDQEVEKEIEALLNEGKQEQEERGEQKQKQKQEQGEGQEGEEEKEEEEKPEDKSYKVSRDEYLMLQSFFKLQKAGKLMGLLPSGTKNSAGKINKFTLPVAENLSETDTEKVEMLFANLLQVYYQSVNNALQDKGITSSPQSE